MNKDNSVSIVSCSKCGKNKTIVYVCMSQMVDKPDGTTTYGIALCKDCNTSKNKCKHPICRVNYYGELALQLWNYGRNPNWYRQFKEQKQN